MQEVGIGYCRLGCAEGPHGSLPVPTAVDRGAPKRSEKGPERRERGGGDRRRARRLATCRGPGAGGQPLVASPHCYAEQGSALSHQARAPTLRQPPQAAGTSEGGQDLLPPRSNSLTNWSVSTGGEGRARGQRSGGTARFPGWIASRGTPDAVNPAPFPPRGAPHSPPPIGLLLQRGSSRPSSQQRETFHQVRTARRAGRGRGRARGRARVARATRGARRPATPRPTGGWRRRRDRPAATPPPRGRGGGGAWRRPPPAPGGGGGGARGRRGAGAPAPLPFPARAGAQGRSGQRSGALGGLWHAMAASHPHHPPPPLQLPSAAHPTGPSRPAREGRGRGRASGGGWEGPEMGWGMGAAPRGGNPGGVPLRNRRTRER